MYQSNLLKNFTELDRFRTRTSKGKGKKRNTFESVNAHYEGWDLSLNAFRKRIFPIKKITWKVIENINS